MFTNSHDDSKHYYPIFSSQAGQVEDYFVTAGDQVKTSDRTLARLGRMEVEEIAEALAEVSPAPYDPLVRSMQKGYEDCFTHWMYLLWWVQNNIFITGVCHDFRLLRVVNW